MKKTLVRVFTAAMVFSIGTANASAANPAITQNAANTSELRSVSDSACICIQACSLLYGIQETDPTGNGYDIHFIDADGDGICDYCGTQPGNASS